MAHLGSSNLGPGSLGRPDPEYPPSRVMNLQSELAVSHQAKYNVLLPIHGEPFSIEKSNPPTWPSPISISSSLHYYTDIYPA